MRVLHLLGTVGILGALTTPAIAHHTTAAFDMRTVTSIEGVVSRYDWSNPHVYVYIDTTNDAGQTTHWTVEAGSPSVMRVRGWSKESFHAGETVHVKMNPARDPARKVGLVVSVQTAGISLPGLMGPLPPGGRSADLPKATGLGGTWVPVAEPSVHQKLRMQPSVLPLTAKGVQSLESFRESSVTNPASKCIAPVAPVLMIIPEVKAIDPGSDVIRIRSEGFEGERLVHMNVTSHDTARPTAQGHSIGHWQGDVLVIDTAAFAENRVGNAIGLASGTHKHLVERLQLNPDGRSLKYSFVLEDVDYLQSPVTGELQWTYRPDLKYSHFACNSENARRFSDNPAQ